MATTKENIYLTCLLAGTLVLETMDELQGTGAYRHELKQSGKTFIRHLEKMVDRDVPLIWGLDDEAMYRLLGYQKEIITELAAMRPEDIGVVLELLRMYKGQPAKTLRRMEIKIVDSSNIPGKGAAANV